MPIFFVYLFAFIILVINQSRFIFGGDSAEFSLVARTWSIAHPPGYPFYSLLINIVNRIIPFGTTPWKIATVSSASTILASVILYLLLRKFKVDKFIALFASLFYIILFPIWEYSEIPEVFALHNLLAISVTYFILLFIEKKNGMYLYIAALLVGVSVSHHHIFVLFVPGWLYLLLRKQGKMRPLSLLTKKAMAITAAFFILGCSFYLYAPIASSFSPPLNWENSRTFDGFIRLITRATYGTFKAYTGSSGNILNQIYDIISLFIFMAMDFRIIGIILVFLGMFAFRDKTKPYYMFLIISLLMHVFLLFYTNFVLIVPFTLAMYERFLIPLYMILVFFLAFGLQLTLQFLDRHVRKHLKNRLLRKSLPYFLPVFMVLYFFIVASQNYKTISKIPSIDIFATYAKNLLDTPPKNSIFFVGADNSHFTTAYYHFGTNYRPDLKFIFVNQLDKKYYRDYVRKLYPGVYIPAAYDEKNMIDFLQKNKKVGLYLENPYGSSWKPYGMLWKQYDSEEEAISDSANLVIDNTRLWQNVYKIPQLDDDLKKILHLNVVQGVYLNDFLSYSRLLFATNHIDEARKVVATLSGILQNDLRTKFILVNLYLYDNKCEDAGKIIRTFDEKTILQNAALLPSMKDYYLICHPEEKNKLRIIQEKENDNRKSISDI